MDSYTVASGRGTADDRSSYSSGTRTGSQNHGSYYDPQQQYSQQQYQYQQQQQPQYQQQYQQQQQQQPSFLQPTAMGTTSLSTVEEGSGGGDESATFAEGTISASQQPRDTSNHYVQSFASSTSYHHGAADEDVGTQGGGGGGTVGGGTVGGSDGRGGGGDDRSFISFDPDAGGGGGSYYYGGGGGGGGDGTVVSRSMASRQEEMPPPPPPAGGGGGGETSMGYNHTDLLLAAPESSELQRKAMEFDRRHIRRKLLERLERQDPTLRDIDAERYLRGEQEEKDDGDDEDDDDDDASVYEDTEDFPWKQREAAVHAALMGGKTANRREGFDSIERALEAHTHNLHYGKGKESAWSAQKSTGIEGEMERQRERLRQEALSDWTSFGNLGTSDRALLKAREDSERAAAREYALMEERRRAAESAHDEKERQRWNRHSLWINTIFVAIAVSFCLVFAYYLEIAKIDSYETYVPKEYEIEALSSSNHKDRMLHDERRQPWFSSSSSSSSTSSSTSPIISDNDGKDNDRNLELSSSSSSSSWSLSSPPTFPNRARRGRRRLLLEAPHDDKIDDDGNDESDEKRKESTVSSVASFVSSSSSSSSSSSTSSLAMLQQFLSQYYAAEESAAAAAAASAADDEDINHNNGDADVWKDPTTPQGMAMSWLSSSLLWQKQQHHLDQRENNIDDHRDDELRVEGEEWGEEEEDDDDDNENEKEVEASSWSLSSSAATTTSSSSSTSMTMTSLIQRYVLATLFYATGGDRWKYPSHFLSPSLHECEWNELLLPSVGNDDFDDVQKKKKMDISSNKNVRPGDEQEDDEQERDDDDEELVSSSTTVTMTMMGVAQCRRGRVTALLLPSNNLVGYLPSELDLLTHLETMYLEGNPNLLGKNHHVRSITNNTNNHRHRHRDGGVGDGRIQDISTSTTGSSTSSSTSLSSTTAATAATAVA